LVRASVCGTEGRGFKTHHSPHITYAIVFNMGFLVLIIGVIVVFVGLNIIGLGLYLSVGGALLAGMLINQKL
jgi:hypothetical protein